MNIYIFCFIQLLLFSTWTIRMQLPGKATLSDFLRPKQTVAFYFVHRPEHLLNNLRVLSQISAVSERSATGPCKVQAVS